MSSSRLNVLTHLLWAIVVVLLAGILIQAKPVEDSKQVMAADSKQNVSEALKLTAEALDAAIKRDYQLGCFDDRARKVVTDSLNNIKKDLELLSGDKAVPELIGVKIYRWLSGFLNWVNESGNKCFIDQDKAKLAEAQNILGETYGINVGKDAASIGNGLLKVGRGLGEVVSVVRETKPPCGTLVYFITPTQNITIPSRHSIWDWIVIFDPNNPSSFLLPGSVNLLSNITNAFNNLPKNGNELLAKVFPPWWWGILAQRGGFENPPPDSPPGPSPGGIGSSERIGFQYSIGAGVIIPWPRLRAPADMVRGFFKTIRNDVVRAELYNRPSWGPGLSNLGPLKDSGGRPIGLNLLVLRLPTSADVNEDDFKSGKAHRDSVTAIGYPVINWGKKDSLNDLATIYYVNTSKIGIPPFIAAANVLIRPLGRRNGHLYYGIESLNLSFRAQVGSPVIQNGKKIAVYMGDNQAIAIEEVANAYEIMRDAVNKLLNRQKQQP